MTEAAGPETAQISGAVMRHTSGRNLYALGLNKHPPPPYHYHTHTHTYIHTMPATGPQANLPIHSAIHSLRLLQRTFVCFGAYGKTSGAMVTICSTMCWTRASRYELLQYIGQLPLPITHPATARQKLGAVLGCKRPWGGNASGHHFTAPPPLASAVTRSRPQPTWSHSVPTPTHLVPDT